jgi:hypothetical protein
MEDSSTEKPLMNENEVKSDSTTTSTTHNEQPIEANQQQVNAEAAKENENAQKIKDKIETENKIEESSNKEPDNVNVIDTAEKSNNEHTEKKVEEPIEKNEQGEHHKDEEKKEVEAPKEITSEITAEKTAEVKASEDHSTHKMNPSPEENQERKHEDTVEIKEVLVESHHADHKVEKVHEHAGHPEKIEAPEHTKVEEIPEVKKEEKVEHKEEIKQEAVHITVEPKVEDEAQKKTENHVEPKIEPEIKNDAKPDHKEEVQHQAAETISKEAEVKVEEKKEEPKAVIDVKKEEVKEELKATEQAAEPELSVTEQTIRTIDKLVQDVLDEMQNHHRIDDAYQKYESLTALCAGIRRKGDKEVNAHMDQIFKKHKRTFADLTSFSKYIKQIVVDIESEKGWTTEKSSEGYTIKYKTGGSEVASLKIEGVMDVPLENLLALIYELDLYNLWLPFMKTTTELKIVNKGCKISYMRLNIPPPLSDRETLIMGFGADRFHINGTVLVLAKSIDADLDIVKDYEVPLPPNRSNVLLAMNVACFEFMPMGPEKVRLRAIVNVDPKIGWVPNSILNFILRKAGSGIYEKMAKTAKNIKGTQWEERMKSEKGKEFYGWLKKRIQEEIYTKNGWVKEEPKK